MFAPPCWVTSVEGFGFQALVVLLQDEVDHAADRVGTVDRGGAVLQHFDALDRRIGIEFRSTAEPFMP
jgi:hypothetical protein